MKRRGKSDSSQRCISKAHNPPKYRQTFCPQEGSITSTPPIPQPSQNDHSLTCTLQLVSFRCCWKIISRGLQGVDLVLCNMNQNGGRGGYRGHKFKKRKRISVVHLCSMGCMVNMIRVNCSSIIFQRNVTVNLPLAPYFLGFTILLKCGFFLRLCLVWLRRTVSLASIILPPGFLKFIHFRF